mmetsp:Transcript_27080/g.41533  ORF Transcript_27080/g.41533 Transcript_27080/m.41533 type:complete len:202 (+) Transcript_27080:208-813(+)
MIRLLVLVLVCVFLPSLMAFSSLQPALFNCQRRLSVVGRRASRNFSLHVGSMINLDDDNYASLFNGKKATLVDACAQWCGPCKLIEPVLNRCAQKWSERIEMAKFDVEAKNPNLKVEMLLQNVMPKSLPSLILFRNGEALAKHNGIITEDQLNDFLETHLKVTSQAAPDSRNDSVNIEPKKKAGFVSFANDDDDYMLSGLN